MRKFLSVLLAMAMVLSLSVTSFAADTDSEAKAEMAGKTVILHTNDVHGAIEGYAYITALKADYEAKGAEVILVDAGDYSQGEVYVSDTKGLDAVEMMNVTGYDVVTLGNHEFDYGYAQLKENMTKADFKILCANVYGEDGIPIFDANYTYTTKSGVKIGFFGMETPEAQTKANPALIKGLKFDTDLKAVAEKQLEALKRTQSGLETLISAAAEKLMPFCTIPIIIPATTLIKVIINPAIASPRTNFEAPSIAP